jgi:hypothetical protein
MKELALYRLHDIQPSKKNGKRIDEVLIKLFEE